MDCLEMAITLMFIEALFFGIIIVGLLHSHKGDQELVNLSMENFIDFQNKIDALETKNSRLLKSNVKLTRELSHYQPSLARKLEEEGGGQS